MSVMGTPAAYLRALTGADTVNKDESYLVMGTTGPGDVGPKERLRISEVGLTQIGDVSVTSTLLEEVPTGQTPVQSGVIYSSPAGRCTYTANSYITLMSAFTSSSQYVKWVRSPGTYMDCSFEVWVNGTGDAWSFSWAGSDGNVSNSAVNSYSIVSYFWAGTLTYAFNNVTISSVSLPAASVNGSVWRKVRILWNNGVLKVWFDNALLLSYTDTDQARLQRQYIANTVMSLGGRTGGVSAEIRVRNLVVKGSSAQVVSTGSLAVSSFPQVSSSFCLNAGLGWFSNGAASGGPNSGVRFAPNGDFGIYVAASAWGGQTLTGSTPCTTRTGGYQSNLRFRCMGQYASNGFLWENASETCLMSLNGQTGNLDTLGLITGAGLVSTANVSISAGKTLTVGSSVVVDTDGLIPYSVVKGTPSALTWATLSGKPQTFPPSTHTHVKADINDWPVLWDWTALQNIPQTLMKSDQDNTIVLGKMLKAGSATIVDTDGLIPYQSVKGQPATLTWPSLTGKPSTFLYSDANVILDAGKTLQAGSTTIIDTDGLIPYASVKGQPATLTWSTLQGKPSTFTPSSHTHVKADITDFPTSWPWASITGVPTLTVSNTNVSFQNITTTGVLDSTSRGSFTQGISLSGSDNGTLQGIHLNGYSDHSWGVYRASPGAGRQLQGGSACNPLWGSSSSYQMRFRCYNQQAEGFIFESSQEVPLISINGVTGSLFVKGDTVAQRGYFQTGLAAQESLDGGTSAGIRLWAQGDPSWGIYIASAGAGKSMAGGTTAAALDGATSHHMRFRSQNGWIWERSSDNLPLMSLNTSVAALRVYCLAIDFWATCTQLRAQSYLFAGGGVYGGAGVAEGQGSYIFWNQSLGTGEFNLVNNRGGGVGGFHFTNCNSDGSTNAQLAELNHQGTLSIKGNLLTYQSLSDARLKENITDMESVSERMKRLRPVRFTWREDMGNDNLEGKDDFGLIAQEVQTQFPELVQEGRPAPGSDDPCLILDYPKLVTYLLKHQQELESRLAKLEASVL